MTQALRNKPATEVKITVPVPHEKQAQLVYTKFKRLVVRAGRRGGKTVGVSIRATEQFLKGRRQLYAAPTGEQVGKFWYEVCKNLEPLINLGILKKNEGEQFIEKPGTEQRIKAKTAWNANTLRGDYADDLYLDEFQLMNEDAWEVIGQPMLLDNNGNAIFIYTPPSLKSGGGVSKARDPRHAAKLFKKAEADTTGNWGVLHFTSHENPHISKDALTLIMTDMSKQTYHQEILAEDDEIQLSWLVYRAFNEQIRKVPRFEIPIEWPVHSGHDFGSANPAAIFFAEVKLPLPEGAPAEMRWGDLVAFREYLPGAGYSPIQHIEAFKGLTQGYRVVEMVGGSKDGEKEVRFAYSSNGWPVLEPKIRHVAPRVDKVITLFEYNKIWIFDDLINWIDELMNCLWEPDDEGKPTNKIRHEVKYHLCSAAGYVISGLEPDVIGYQGVKQNRL